MSALAADLPRWSEPGRHRREREVSSSEPAPPALRLFVGIAVPEPARDLAANAAAALRAAGVDARFEPREKLHVTVAFLGAVPPQRLAAVAAALDALELAPFTFALERLGAFPNLRRPRILWLGAQRPQPAFRVCVAAVQGALSPLGFRFDRPPDGRPHLTLARLHAHAPAVQLAFRPAPVSVRVDALSLFSSLPGAGTTRYEIVHRSALRGACAPPRRRER